jgi:hypothetical protein
MSDGEQSELFFSPTVILASCRKAHFQARSPHHDHNTMLPATVEPQVLYYMHEIYRDRRGRGFRPRGL